MQGGIRVKREEPCEVSGKRGNGNTSACTGGMWEAHRLMARAEDHERMVHGIVRESRLGVQCVAGERDAWWAAGEIAVQGSAGD